MIVLVFGSRPESIKLGPVAAELRAAGADVRVIATGQHTDLLRGTPAETDLADAISLGIPARGNPLRWPVMVAPKIASTLRDLEARLIVVQGDTMSALAGAHAARALDLPIAHVEAGVRSGSLDEPWPEEGFRREISALAALHLAATPTAYANLLAEGVLARDIRLTGNPVVSALARYAETEARAPQPYLVVTMHRREWREHDDPRAFLRALERCAEARPFVDTIWPVHPAVAPMLPKRSDAQNVWLEKPLPYVEMIALLRGACGLITDSGGLVEEAATLGIPAAIMRRHNDRPEAVEAGVALRFDPDENGVAMAFDALAGGALPRRPSDLYGAPDAAAQIARALVRFEETL